MNLDALADPARPIESIDLDGQDGQLLIRDLRMMLLVRDVETLISTMLEAGEVRCPCHLAIGQEAVSVGVARSLRPTDRTFGAHRAHAQFLALGGDPFALFAEVLGRAAGCSRGMGGSMHLWDRSIGLFGTVPIVAATVPMAVGAALAARLEGVTDIGVAFLGDGASEEGVFHESMNLAGSMRLPVLFVVENNLFSSHLHISLRQPYSAVARYGPPHGVKAETVDGNDLVAVASMAAELISGIRSGGGPALLEAVTYRWKGHVGHRDDLDVGVRRGSELGAWKGRDPILRLRKALETAGYLDAAAWYELRTQVQDETMRALGQARLASYPEPEELLGTVYASQSQTQ